ncbi:MAG: hypothetical protein D6808_07445 [Candidatus Dadabacteria bacterium]|nr:MAG: hypothetical protein D6808_07445 [Candidatus Dadabacteria bacterium]
MAEAKKTLKKKYTRVHKYTASLALLAFAVIIISGLRAEVSIMTIAYRSFVAMVVIAFLAKIIIRALASFEEIESG